MHEVGRDNYYELDDDEPDFLDEIGQHVLQFGSSLEDITGAMVYQSKNKEIIEKDLAGIWWMKDNPFPELLASLCNAKSGIVDGSLVIHAYTDAPGCWAWPANWFGGSIIAHETMLWYYLLWQQRDSKSSLEFVFQNDGNAVIKSTLGGSGFMKTPDPDVWIRPMGMKGEFDTSSKYYFTRIVDCNGRPTKYFQEWTNFSKSKGCCGAETRMVTYASQNWWGRVRQLLLHCPLNIGLFCAGNIDIDDDEEEDYKAPKE